MRNKFAEEEKINLIEKKSSHVTSNSTYSTFEVNQSVGGVYNETSHYIPQWARAIVFVMFGLATTVIIWNIDENFDAHPLESDAMTPLIGVKSVNHPLKRSSKWGNIWHSYPTGAFWTNFIQHTDDDLDHDLYGNIATARYDSSTIIHENKAVGAYPYDLKCTTRGLEASYSAYRRFASSLSIADIFMPDISLSVAMLYPDYASGDVYLSFNNSFSREVLRYDNASVTMGYTMQSYVSPIDNITRHSTPSMEEINTGRRETDFHVLVVKGAPFVTVEYDLYYSVGVGGKTRTRGASRPKLIKSPTISSEFDIQKVEFFHPHSGTTSPIPVYNTSTARYDNMESASNSEEQFYIVHLANYQQWLVYTAHIEGFIAFSPGDNMLYFNNVFDVFTQNTGSVGSLRSGVNDASGSVARPIIRIAVLPLPNPLIVARELAKYASCYPVGMDMHFLVDDAQNEAYWVYAMKTAGVCEDTTTNVNTDVEINSKLLMMALPHHLNLIQFHEATSNKFVSTHFSNIRTSYPNRLRGDEISFYCIKGKMTPLVGNSWILKYRVEDTPWVYAPTLSSVSDMPGGSSASKSCKNSRFYDSAELNRILLYLERDVGDPGAIQKLHEVGIGAYEFGKRVNRMARLALSAAEVLEKQYGFDTSTSGAVKAWESKCESLSAADRTVFDKLRSLQVDALNQSKTALIPWLNASMSTTHVNESASEPSIRTILPSDDEKPVYDSTYGGWVPLRGLKNSGVDFGAGYYSDHHFHYGYFLVAAAVIIKYNHLLTPGHDRNVLSSIRNDHPLSFETETPYRSIMDMWYRDVCNMHLTHDSAAGSSVYGDTYFFPYVRHKDFFDGHSWASGGLLPQGNGKSQESSSEAVNAYYGCSLYAEATGRNQYERHFAKLLLAMEVQSVETYWHMSGPNSLYDDIFSYTRMVGNIGSTDVTSTTWFGAQPAFVHGINIMPISPVTARLFQDKTFVQQEWEYLTHHISHLIPNTTYAMNTNDTDTKHYPSMGTPFSNNNVIFTNYDALPAGDIAGEWLALLYGLHAVIDNEAATHELSSMVTIKPDTLNPSGDRVRIDYDFGTGSSLASMTLFMHSQLGPKNDSKSLDVLVDIHPYPMSPVVNPSCSANSACVTVGMGSGDCCPVTSTVNNVTTSMYLGCCPIIIIPQVSN